MMFDGATIARATGGRLVREGAAGSVTTDSRRVAPGAWFVALPGEKFDGHDFLPMVAASGAAGAIVSREPPGWTAGLVVVPDTVVALQDLARQVRAEFSGPVIGITGSAGKTSTRVMVVDVLSSLGHVHHTQGNLNNHLGLPLTLCAMPPDADALVVELGMSHLHEIELLQDISAPTIRLITNVGAAHVEGCGSLEGVAAAKQELFDGARPGNILCVNVDDPWISAMPHPEGVQVITYGAAEHATIRLTDVAVDAARLQTRLRIETPDGSVKVTLDVPGAHLAINAAAATAVAWALRIPIEMVGPALSRFKPEGMRNRVEVVAGMSILDDAYNANPISMLAALNTLSSLNGRRFAALGDMLELGGAEEASHHEVLAAATSGSLTAVHVTGSRMAAAAAEFPTVVVHADAEALAEALVSTLAPGDVLLVKGSRGARMERVIERLRAARRS